MQAKGSQGEWWTGLAALVVTVLAAVIEDWQASDIVWGMWISSLVSGYVMILTIIAADVLHGRNPADTSEQPAPPRARLLGALAMLAFFSFHFLFFHAGHAMFTQQFFPLAGAQADAHELLDNFVTVTPLALSAYWPLVLATFVARGDWFREAVAGNTARTMSLPYRAVVKNHLMIFIVFGAMLAGLQGWLLYLLFLWYFVPGAVWRPMMAKLRPRSARQQKG